jgi:UDP-N-acetylmuramoylalanine--D-glutamate ligase
VQPVKSKRVTVFGLGRFGGGIAVSRWLVEQGAHVRVVDKEPAEKLAESVQKLHGLPIEFRLGDLKPEDLTSSDLVVASPAVPPHNPLLVAAKEAGVPITTEIRLFIERCPATILAVTGTKGKSTTTAMLGEILKKRFPTFVGGNIGGSLLEKLDQIGKTDLVALELSSFMLDHLAAAKWSPHVGVVTMLGADHLDWHGSHHAYIEAKKNLLRFQRTDDYAVLNETDAGSAGLKSDAPGHVILYGLENRKLFDLRLPGRHNQINAQGAFAAAQIVGLSWDEAQEALADFKGLPHRLELVHEASGVKWYNDSIATIPEAAVAALDSFAPKKVLQIIGGKDKGLPAAAMCAALIERAKAVLCVGATGGMLAETLQKHRSQSGAEVYACGDLPTAVSVGRRIAVSGDVVLLSPGYPSYDQFVNFEARGDAFSQLARGNS